LWGDVAVSARGVNRNCLWLRCCIITLQQTKGKPKTLSRVGKLKKEKMKKQLLCMVSVLVAAAGFFACTKGESTATTTTNTAAPKLEYATYTSLIDALKSQGYTQKDSLNSAERAVLKGPVLTAQQLAANGATRLFFVKGTQDIIQLVKKTTPTWNLPDSIYYPAAVKSVGIYSDGATKTRVMFEDETSSGTGTVVTLLHFLYDPVCDCWRAIPPHRPRTYLAS
jgi:hypothetical protein